MEYFWKDKKAGIDYRQFVNLVTKFEIRLKSKLN